MFSCCVIPVADACGHPRSSRVGTLHNGTPSDTSRFDRDPSESVVQPFFRSGAARREPDTSRVQRRAERRSTTRLCARLSSLGQYGQPQDRPTCHTPDTARSLAATRHATSRSVRAGSVSVDPYLCKAHLAFYIGGESEIRTLDSFRSSRFRDGVFVHPVTLRTLSKNRVKHKSDHRWSPLGLP